MAKWKNAEWLDFSIEIDGFGWKEVEETEIS